MKWYRGNFEIFRFIADEDPPTKIFKLDSFDVDVSADEQCWEQTKKGVFKRLFKSPHPLLSQMVLMQWLLRWC